MKARWSLYYIYAQVSFGSKVVPSQNQECQLATDFKYMKERTSESKILLFFPALQLHYSLGIREDG